MAAKQRAPVAACALLVLHGVWIGATSAHVLHDLFAHDAAECALLRVDVRLLVIRHASLRPLVTYRAVLVQALHKMPTHHKPLINILHFEINLEIPYIINSIIEMTCK